MPGSGLLWKTFGDVRINPVNVIACSLYHEYDGDVDRFNYYVVRRGRGRTTCGGKWLGTPELTEIENTHLYCLALENNLIHKDMPNYHPEKAKESEALRHEHMSAYQPSPKPLYKFVTQAERVHNRKRALAKKNGIHIAAFKKRKHFVQEEAPKKESLKCGPKGCAVPGNRGRPKGIKNGESQKSKKHKRVYHAHKRRTRLVRQRHCR